MSQNQPEFLLQCEVFDSVIFMSLEKDCHDLDLFHASFNGVRVSRKVANDMKLSGLLPGLCDTNLPVARCGYIGLYIELKKPGGKCKQPDPNQKIVINRLRAVGHFCAVMNDHNQIVKLVRDYILGNTDDLDVGVF